MENEFNRYKYLMYQIIDEYSIDKQLAKEYLIQMLHVYLHVSPEVDFSHFFNIITDVLVTLFN